MTAHGGRPRDPEVDQRVIQAAIHILATDRMPGFTAEAIAERGRLGKASIYRRWPSIHVDLLAAVVAELGIRDDTVGTLGSGDTREDLLHLLTSATTGTRALAEAAVLPGVGRYVELRRAYADGPLARLEAAIDVAAARAENRFEPRWPSNAPIAGGVALLLLQIQATGLPPDDEDIEQVLDQVVLPGLGLQAVPS